MENQINLSVTNNITVTELIPIQVPQVSRLVINFYICPDVASDLREQDYHRILLAKTHRKCVCHFNGMNLHQLERTIIETILALKLRNRVEAAQELGLDVRTLFNRIRQYHKEDRMAKQQRGQDNR